MNNIIQSLTRAICSTADTVSELAGATETGAKALGRMSDAGYIRADSYANTTEIRVQHNEDMLRFDLDLSMEELKKRMKSHAKTLSKPPLARKTPPKRGRPKK